MGCDGGACGAGLDGAALGGLSCGGAVWRGDCPWLVLEAGDCVQQFWTGRGTQDLLACLRATDANADKLAGSRNSVWL